MKKRKTPLLGPKPLMMIPEKPKKKIRKKVK